MANTGAGRRVGERVAVLSLLYTIARVRRQCQHVASQGQRGGECDAALTTTGSCGRSAGVPSACLPSFPWETSAKIHLRQGGGWLVVGVMCRSDLVRLHAEESSKREMEITT